MNPLIKNIPLTLDKPSQSDKRGDRERLADGLAAITGDDIPVEIGIDILRDLPAALRKNDFSVTVTVGFPDYKAKVIALDKKRVFGIALDIGTTNIVASLFDLGDAKKVGTMETENPQVSVGLDVLTRMHATMSGGSGGKDELHAMLLKGVNGLIAKLCGAYDVRPSDICAAVIAGNTVMSHFLMNLPVDNVPVEPYVPVANRFSFLSPGDIGLEIFPSGTVYVFPNAGSYVGGDIIAGIFSSGLHKGKETSALIDVGTNAEIVLGCDEWIMVGAGAAGPALESGISDAGMRAVEGAIYSVNISKEAGLKIKTIGGVEPVGICGSGMIELVSELFEAGIIDRQGKFSGSDVRVSNDAGRQSFVVYEKGDRRIVIKETDIENFLRSKAAMFASLYVMVKSVGLVFGDISKMYVSGAFGKEIDPDKAIRIGMLPGMDRNRFGAIGNSSLEGAGMLLLDRGLLADIDRICEMITYREMNTDGEFMKEFPGALFIPHTDPGKLEQ